MSTATLRRHRAAEGATLGDLLMESRMACALTLMQGIDHPVNRAARDRKQQS